MFQTITELRNLLGNVLRHPNNRHARVAAAFRFLRWQIHKRLIKKPVVIPVGRNRSFKVVCDSKFSSMVLYNVLPDWDEMNFLLRFLRPEDAFIDIGANVGFYTILASTIVIETPILAIEANPRNASVLREQIALNNVGNIRMLETALGDAESTLMFDDCGRETGSLAHEGVSFQRQIEVRCTLLDTLLAGNALADCIVAKMDVEGCEEMILRGAKETLKRGDVSVWLFELADAGLRRHGSSSERLIQVFEQSGYSILYWDEERQHLGHRGDEADSDRGNYLACRNEAFVRERLSAKSRDGSR